MRSTTDQITPENSTDLADFSDKLLDKFFPNYTIEILEDFFEKIRSNPSIEINAKEINLAGFYLVVVDSANGLNSDQDFGAKLLALKVFDQKLLDQQIKIDDQIYTPMSLAIKMQNINAIKLLMTMGADIDNQIVAKQLTNCFSKSQPNAQEIKNIKEISQIFARSGIAPEINPRMQFCEGLKVVGEEFANLEMFFKICQKKAVSLSPQQAIDFVKIALEKFQDYSSERLRGQRDIDPLNNLEIVVGANNYKFPVNAFFLNKLLKQISVDSSMQYGCCGIFSRRKNNLEDYFKKFEPEIYKKILEFRIAFDSHLHIPEIVRTSMSQSRTSSLEINPRRSRLSQDGSGHSAQANRQGEIIPRNRDDIFDSLEDASISNLPEGSGHSEQENVLENNGLGIGIIEIGHKIINVPAPDLDSPSRQVMRGIIAGRSFPSFSNLPLDSLPDPLRSQSADPLRNSPRQSFR